MHHESVMCIMSQLGRLRDSCVHYEWSVMNISSQLCTL